MALYTNISWDEFDKIKTNPDQTRVYDMIARDISDSNGNNGDDNFFAKRGKSIENAIGTTGAAIVSGIDSARESAKANSVSDNMANNLDKIAQKYGFADRGAYWDALSAAEESGNTDELNRLDTTVGAEMRGETSSAAKEADKAAKDWQDYRTNSYVGQKINQDRGKFLGSAINTLSTGFDVMAPGAGILANSLQGGIEGIADELEQNGLENFDWERAGQNALTGAATGAVTGALNKGISNKLAKNGGNLFKGGNALTRSLNNLGSQTAAGRIGSTLATGAARGAVSGAVGGATGAGLSAVMNGQDVLGSAIQGAQQGFGQGALAGGVMAGANMAANRVGNAINDFRAESDEGFGRRYNQFSGDGDKAIDYLLKRGGGEVEGAVRSPAVEAVTGDGNVDIVYGKGGNDGYGLAHIVEKHGEDVAKKIPSILENGKVVDDPNYTNSNRVTLVSDDNTGAVRLGWDGNKKQWVVTAYEGLPYSSAPSAVTQIDNSAPLRGSSVQGQNGATVDSNIPQNRQNVNSTASDEPFLAYGESNLANRTRRGMLADSLERLGNTLEGAQTNVTRASAKDLGIESTGKVVENVRKKTGITNLETQAQLARELTGGDNSLMDRVQRNALSSREDGGVYKVDTTPVIDELETIVNKYADTNMFGSKDAKERFINNLKTDISNMDTDVLGISNRMKSNAADLRGKGVTSPTPTDSAKAKIYTEVANKLDDLSYKAIPQENVEAMFDATISEMRGRAMQARNNGNNDVARAYEKLANSLDAEPRTIKAFRSFKKDFVDISKINELTARAENGAAAQMGRSFGGGLKRFASTVAQRPVNAALAKAGGAINSIADRVDGERSVTPIASGQEMSVSTTSSPATRIYDMIGRTEGLNNAEQARTADYLINAAQEAEVLPNGNNVQDINNGTTVLPNDTNSTSVYNALTGGSTNNNQTAMQTNAIAGNSYFPTTGDYWTDILGKAMSAAIEADDVAAFASLYGMYQDSLSNLQKNNNKDYSNPTNWNSSDRSKLLSAQNAMDQIDQLESAYNSATGGQGGNFLQGNLRSLAANISGGNLDASANNYNKLAESVGMGIVKNLINLGVTEADAKRYLEYLPALTDTKEQAAQKLDTLRNIYQRQINNLYSAYGV